MGDKGGRQDTGGRKTMAEVGRNEVLDGGQERETRARTGAGDKGAGQNEGEGRGRVHGSKDEGVQGRTTRADEDGE